MVTQAEAAQAAGRLKKDFTTLYGLPHLCPVCGSILQPRYLNSICEGLARDWELTETQRRFFHYREGCRCASCGSPTRIRNLARSVLEVINLKCGTGLQVFKDIGEAPAARKLHVAEINNCAALHAHLAQLPHLKYSEYGSDDPSVPSEDLTALSYADGAFDLVLMTDVLEHVPDYRRGLFEIERILREDGLLIFTVPFLMSRETVVRARQESDGTLTHLKSPSYHGDYAQKRPDLLVMYEFGYDFPLELTEVFSTSIYACDGFGDLVASVFVCRKGI